MLQQRAELHLVVAGEAGVGRAAAGVLADEVVDDVFLELALQVEHVVADAERVGGGAGVVRVFDGAAALVVAGGAGVLLRPEAHGDADDVVTLAGKQARGDGRIDAAGHGDNHTRFRHSTLQCYTDYRLNDLKIASGGYLQPDELAHKITDILSDMQAEDILLLDIRNAASFADYFVIGDREQQPPAGGDPRRRSTSGLAKKRSYARWARRGSPDAGWVLLDYGDVIVHLFGAEERAYYDLEGLWATGVPVVRIV